MMNEIAKLSGHLWRPRKITAEYVQPSWDVPDLRTLLRETPQELDAFSRSPLAQALSAAERGKAPVLPQPGRRPIVGDELSNDSIRHQMAMLSDAVAQVRPGLLRPVSFEATPQMAEHNQLAYDRMAALSQDDLRNVLAAGRPQQSTLFLQRMASEISGTPVPAGGQDPAQLEEIFHAIQTPHGDAKVLGRTLINNEWYHFGTTSGTSPLQQASTWIAPTRLMTSPDPAALTDLNAGRVLKDVQSLFEGRWKPYLKGAGLLEKPHTVDIRHADKDGIKSILATLEKVTKTLKTIQSVTKGIQDGLEFLGMMGSLGDLGKYMAIFNKMKLPGTPGELITALITGKGISPNKPPKPPTADQTGCSSNGVVITKAGAAAAAVGDGLLAEAKAEQEKAEQEKAEQEKAEQEKAEQEKAEKEKAEQEKAEQEKAEKEKAEQEKAEKEKAEKEKAEKEKAEKEKAEKEKADKEKADKEKADKEKADKEKADKEKADKEKADKEKADKEKADKEKADKEKTPLPEAKPSEREYNVYKTEDKAGALIVSGSNGYTYIQDPETGEVYKYGHWSFGVGIGESTGIAYSEQEGTVKLPSNFDPTSLTNGSSAGNYSGNYGAGVLFGGTGSVDTDGNMQGGYQVGPFMEMGAGVAENHMTYIGKYPSLDAAGYSAIWQKDKMKK